MLKKVLSLASSDLETSCSTVLTFINQSYKECSYSHKIPPTPKPWNSVNQVNFSVTEHNLGVSWGRYILSLQNFLFFHTERHQKNSLRRQWFVCVWGYKAFYRTPNWNNFLEASAHSNSDFLLSFLRIAMKETLFKNREDE